MTDAKSGHTSRQMLAAERYSIYVWYHDHCEYARKLADHLGRFDLKVMPANWLKGNLRTWRGTHPNQQIVIDHGLIIDFQIKAAIYALSIRNDVVMFQDLEDK